MNTIRTAENNKEKESYLLTIDGDDLVIAGDSGVILASNDQSKIGQKISPEELANLDKTKKISFREDGQAVSIVSEKNNKSDDLIKTFAKVFFQEHLENNKNNINSTDQFIRQLINAPNPSDPVFIDQMESEAKILGYDLTVKRTAIIISFDGFFQNYLLECPRPTYERDKAITDWKRKIENTLATFFTKNRDMITAYLGENKFIVFKALGDSNEEKFTKLMKSAFNSIFGPLKNHSITEIKVGFGHSSSGIDGLINSYNEADFALELGQVFLNRTNCYYFGDLGILYILADGNRNKKIQFANGLLSKLRNDELVRTLEAFFENNLNISDTADHLGIHRNTVIYRLDRLTNYLDLDPRNFVDAVTIKIALLLKRISNANQMLESVAGKQEA